MSNQFKTKEFKALQIKWEAKLKKAGFKDLERKDRWGRAEERLQTDTMENVANRGTTVEEFEATQDYYRIAGQFLHEHKFKTQVEKKIWELHAEGDSIRVIIKKLKHRGITAYKDLVQTTINRLADEMKDYARNRQAE